MFIACPFECLKTVFLNVHSMAFLIYVYCLFLNFGSFQGRLDIFFVDMLVINRGNVDFFMDNKSLVFTVNFYKIGIFTPL